MPVADDNFRIEVWDKDETARLELISRTPDLHVSMSAWHTAIRRRPGALLIHWNGSHVIDRMLAPGDASPAAPRDVTFDDLREWHLLKAFCSTCRHRSPLDARKLVRRFGKQAALAVAEGKLFCTKCKSRSAVRLEIYKAMR